MGDISKQFNMEAIVKKLAGAVNKMNLAKKNENYAPTDAIADLKSIGNVNVCVCVCEYVCI